MLNFDKVKSQEAYPPRKYATHPKTKHAKIPNPPIAAIWNSVSSEYLYIPCFLATLAVVGFGSYCKKVKTFRKPLGNESKIRIKGKINHAGIGFFK